MMRSGLNRNKWNYQNLDEHYMSALGCPILCAFPGGRIGDGHLMEERIDANGEKYYSFISKPGLEQVVGTISDDPKDLKLIEEDGETWLVAEGRLFDFYAHELVEYIKRQGVMEVSVETEVIEGHIDQDDPNVEVFTNYNIIGVTILGSGVAPAIPGANIKALQEIESEFQELKLRAASLINAEDDDDEDDDNVTVDPGENKEPDEGTETKKPQTQLNRKGESTMQVFTKKQVADLAPKFEGYTVLAAGRNDAGIHVCLMAADGSTATYTMDSMDAMIDPKKITDVDLYVQFAFGEEHIDIESDVLTAMLSANLVKANTELTATKEKLTTAEESLESMEAAEKRRRLKAAKAAAKEALAKFNANREEKVNEAILDDINAAVDAGAYTECINGEGDWCGEEAVCNAVLAKCAAAVMEFDKAAVARNAAKAQSQYLWDMAKEDPAKANDVASLLAKWKAEKI